MTNIRYFLLVFLSIVLFLSSCKDPNEYRIDPEFTDYLQRFENEAGTRGRSFDLTKTGLIIEFGTLESGTAGLTHYEDPIRIQIDKTYWNAISSSAGADMMKEDLIFHELGHGLLGRKHLNTTLENGEWKSIMCGGTKVNNRPWNINYKGVRRQYYIDELFDSNTAAPDFSSNQFVADSTGYVSKLKLSFDNAESAGWKIEDITNYKTSIENGRLKFESKVKDIYLVFAKTNIDIQSDFSFEFSIEYSSVTDLTGQYGLVFGDVPDGSNAATDPVEYFSINKSQKMYMGNRTWYSFFTELTENQINTAGRNKLKIFKTGTMLYYFINDVYSYCSEIETATSGSHFGFMVPSKGTVLLDNLTISQRSSAGVSSQKIKTGSVEFMCVPVKSLNNNLLDK